MSDVREVTPGVTYEANGDYRLVDFAMGGSIRLRIEWLDADGVTLSFSGDAPIVSTFSFVWYPFPTVTATAPEGAAFARLRFEVYLPTHHASDLYSVYFDGGSLIGEFPALLSDSLYAFKAIYESGMLSDFSEWLVPHAP